MKKKFFALISAAVICLSLSVTAFASDAVEPTDEDTVAAEIGFSTEYARVLDDAALLSEMEADELIAKLDEIRYRQKTDVAVVTVEDLEGSTATEYADDVYDYLDFGCGEEKDGILLLISMEDRDWAISTRGRGIDIFTDSIQENITDEIIPYLSDGDYAKAFDTFADLCDEYITDYDLGDDVSLSWVLVPMCLVVGLIIAAITVAVMKSKLKSVAYQTGANDYVVNGSLNITESRELFLYHTVTRTAKPKDNGSSGSSTHTSSSGATHGGSSGKF